MRNYIGEGEDVSDCLPIKKEKEIMVVRHLTSYTH